jgi:hypothetical protein
VTVVPPAGGAVVAGALVAPPLGIVAGVPVVPPVEIVSGVPAVPPVTGRSPPDPPHPAADAAKTSMLEMMKYNRTFTAVFSMS